MPKIIVNLALSTDEFMKYYEGAAREVWARAEDGRRVRFPAHILRPFIRHSGIHGRFELEFDADGKFKSITRSQ